MPVFRPKLRENPTLRGSTPGSLFPWGRPLVAKEPQKILVVWRVKWKLLTVNRGKNNCYLKAFVLGSS